MLLVRQPPSYPSERQYILRVLLQEFLGLEYRTELHASHDVVITHDRTARRLVIPDVLFQTAEGAWLTPPSMPQRPLEVLRAHELGLDTSLIPDAVPIIYGQRIGCDAHVAVEEDTIRLGLDLFGSAFFLLTRYEELVTTTRDRRDRFPATASLAFQEGFLDRPVVNEYVELLWSCLSRLFPELRRSERQHRVILSHDVDWPIATLGKSLPQVLRATVGDVAKRKDSVLAARRLESWVQVRLGRFHGDVGNVFDDIMDTSERNGLRSAFFFIASDGTGDIDGAYTVEHPWIRALLRRVHERGHEIGIHPSYRTFRDPCRIRREYLRLRNVCDDEGISQEVWGGRQHYLRWENPTTWQGYVDAGIAYDTTLSFADHVGFRSGVCYEYPVFDLKARQVLALRERPLVVMEATLFGERSKFGMALSIDAGVELIARLKASCEAYRGDFTLLWHNSWLIQSRMLAAYQEAVQLLAAQSVSLNMTPLGRRETFAADRFHVECSDRHFPDAACDMNDD